MNGAGHMIVLTPIKEYLTPGFVMVHHGELIGIIEVDFHHQTVGYFVLGHRVVVHRLVDIGNKDLAQSGNGSHYSPPVARTTSIKVCSYFRMASMADVPTFP